MLLGLKSPTGAPCPFWTCRGCSQEPAILLLFAAQCLYALRSDRPELEPGVLTVAYLPKSSLLICSNVLVSAEMMLHPDVFLDSLGSARMAECQAMIVVLQVV